MILRPYQSLLVSAIRDAYRNGFKSPLLQLPTGGGKTVIFSTIAHGAMKRGNRVLILAHRVELIDQISKALTEAQAPHTIMAAGYDYHHHSEITVASVQTLIRRLTSPPTPDLIVIDEAHHMATGNTWERITTEYPNARRLGVTATPIRQDGKGLGEHFDTLVMGPATQALIDLGFLSAPRVFAPPSIDTEGLHTRMGDYITAEIEARADRPSVTGDALAHYRQHAPGRPAIVFCTSVAHADHVAQSFRDGGYAAVALNGGSQAEIRRMAIHDFRRGTLRVLTSCDLFSEGFDVPGIHCGIMLRPTSSEGLYLQQVGRVLRTAAGKTQAIILDHAGNTQRFGLPTEPREWALTYDETRQKKKPTHSIRVCPQCFAAAAARAATCTNCGFLFPIASREIDARDGELEELTPEKLEALRERRLRGRLRTLPQLEEFARTKGYAPGWAKHVYQARLRKGVT